MDKLKVIIEKSSLKYNAYPFDQIDQDFFGPALDEALSLAKKRLETIKSHPEPPNFENTIKALESCSPELSRVLSVYYHLFSAATTDTLQKISTEFSQKYSQYSSSITLDERLFEKVKTVYAQLDQLTDSEDKKLLEDTYSSFVRNGANLSNDDKELFKSISSELSGLSPQFSQNVLNATNAFSLHITDPKDVEGLPESALNLSKQMAKDKGLEGWVFTLQHPSMIPLLKFCRVREHRKTVFLASNSKGLHGETSNCEIIKKIVNLRLKKAQLLGYKNHAEYTLAERMAENSQNVYKLIDKLYKPSLDFALKDLKEVQQLALELDGISELQPWDFNYYAEKLKQKKLNFDEEDLRPYFEAGATIEGAFTLARKLYQVEFKKTEMPVWHESVETYEVFDQTNNDFLGLFYVDLFPRSNKRAGAWANTIQYQNIVKGEVKRPHALIVCNFSPSTDDNPSLLSLREVTTLFHEFGHALHMLLTQCKHASLSGTNVYRDFVELPSQLMENWVTEKEFLDLFAKHYKTSESIPQNYIDAIIESNQFMSGNFSLRQLKLGVLDMAWHTIENEFDGEVEAFEKQAVIQYETLPDVPQTCMSTHFSHLFAGGYSAGYYGYKWAEILDADAFEYFKENGIFNQKIASKFRTEILEKGGTEHPMTLYKNFRGREPKPEALLRREGFL